MNLFSLMQSISELDDEDKGHDQVIGQFHFTLVENSVNAAKF